MYKIIRMYIQSEENWLLANHEILPKYEDAMSAETEISKMINHSNYTSFIFIGKYI